MAYQSLARKYRPQTFAELMGQDPVALALANAISMGREPHAVIFAGIRGVGKTTTARLYAKALNCEEGPTPEPCGQCESCRAIELGRHQDVLEIDGASNTGVDDVRALRETVDYIPQRSKFRIFIIDEVHMLSQSAFNALLKTLEEPPAHVVFVFATTEMQKIPATITSRCIVFKLNKFSLADTALRLKEILDREGIACEAGALTWIAREGRGSMRDALTFLDQVIALGGGELTMKALTEVLGATPEELYVECLDALLSKDQDRLIRAIAAFDDANITQVVERLAQYCRDLFIIRSQGERAQLIHAEVSAELLASLRRLAGLGDALDWNRIFRWLAKCRVDLDGSNLDRYIFENYALEWCLDPGLPRVDQLLSGASAQPPRSDAKAAAPAGLATPAAPTVPAAPPRERERLSQIRQEMKAPAPSSQPTAPVADKPKIDDQILQGASSSAPQPFPSSWRELVDEWKKLKPMQARVLEDVYVRAYTPQMIELAVDAESLAAAKLLQPSIRTKVKDAFREMFGFTGELSVVLKEVGSDEGAKLDAPSLLSIKQKERDDDKAEQIAKAKDHPLTQVMIKAFDATIEQITVD